MTWFLYAQPTAPIDPCGILFPLSSAIRSLLIRAACLVSGANFHLFLTTHSPKGIGSMLGPKSRSFHHLLMAPHSLTSLLPSLPSWNVTVHHHHSYLAYFPGSAPPAPSSLSDQLQQHLVRPQTHVLRGQHKACQPVSLHSSPPTPGRPQGCPAMLLYPSGPSVTSPITLLTSQTVTTPPIPSLSTKKGPGSLEAPCILDKTPLSLLPHTTASEQEGTQGSAAHGRLTALPCPSAPSNAILLSSS